MPITITSATTVTASDLVTRALRALGIIGRTETASAGDISDGLITFNTMLDSWSNEGLAAYVYPLSSFPLVANQQVYTIGPTGNVVATRPFDIVQAFVRDSNSNDYPMNIIPQNEWNNIGLKTITSQIPTTLFYQPTYPNGQINIFPIPLLAYTLYYVDSQDQTTFTTLTQTLSMPLGYERAFVFNLAVELIAAGFPLLLSPLQWAELKNVAAEAKANVKRSNIREVIAEFDPAIISRSEATYNIYSDSNPRS